MPFARDYDLTDARTILRESEGRNSPWSGAAAHSRERHAASGNPGERQAFTDQQVMGRLQGAGRAQVGQAGGFKNQVDQTAALLQALNSAEGQAAFQAIDQYFANRVGSPLPVANRARAGAAGPQHPNCIRVTLTIGNITRNALHDTSAPSVVHATGPGPRRAGPPTAPTAVVAQALQAILDLQDPGAGAPVVHVQTCYPRTGAPAADQWLWT